MSLDILSCQRGRRREIVEGLSIDMTNEWPVVYTELLYHLRNADNVVVATANKANKRLPSVLSQDSHASELGGFLSKIQICRGPL